MPRKVKQKCNLFFRHILHCLRERLEKYILSGKNSPGVNNGSAYKKLIECLSNISRKCKKILAKI